MSSPEGLMRAKIYTELRGKGKNQLVFEGISVEADLFETLAITSITQSYRNSGESNIEAVFSFPLPLDAVLLGMKITLGEKTLRGVVLPKEEAEEQYEDAITDGDTPVRLEVIQPGLYTMNVGNLLPGDTANITIRYGIFMNWQGSMLRYHLPTTIAPRYGSAQAAGLDPQQEPVTSMIVENRFRFKMRVHGKLVAMSIDSPTHDLTQHRNTNSTECLLTLSNNKSHMDRDLVVAIKSGDTQPSSAVVTMDRDEYLLWGSFQPKINFNKNAPQQRSIKIVIDCSGSMAGDSIIQAKEALIEVIDELGPEDWFNIIAFGDCAISLFREQVQVNEESLEHAKEFLRKIDADMGGTELETALDLAMKIKAPTEINHDILLITDGDIWEWEEIVENVINRKHRFFTVGVGSSVTEAFVKALAEQTGGACVLVSPNENMSERIHTQFKRIRSPHAANNKVIWPMKPIRTYQEEMKAVFDEDTCNFYAWFTNQPVGDVHYEIRSTNEPSTRQTATIEYFVNKTSNIEDIARMVAALKLRTIKNTEEAQKLAVSYQLVSEWTNYLAIVTRDDDDKATTLPDLHNVEQMLAAGWGGTGSVRHMKREIRQEVYYSYNFGTTNQVRGPKYSRIICCCQTPPSKISRLFRLVRSTLGLFSTNERTLPSQQEPKWVWEVYTNNVEQMTSMLDQTISRGNIPQTLSIPFISEELVAAITLMMDKGIKENDAIIVFLYHLVTSDAGKRITKQSRRIIIKRYKELKLSNAEKVLLDGCLMP